MNYQLQKIHQQSSTDSDQNYGIKPNFKRDLMTYQILQDLDLFEYMIFKRKIIFLQQIVVMNVQQMELKDLQMVDFQQYLVLLIIVVGIKMQEQSLFYKKIQKLFLKQFIHKTICFQFQL
ncbi:unnamed protein product [Paramecium sonneborni]|uniref:Uncharacterized protein n=1 Tax=Paramecium sonneborni TaxID=65129 RepID=A0A8S1RP86_9CILI|nr:unnamed protein product [Paramecium sonneborni]